ncbi:MAG: methyltransferase domain-containing protein [Anaerolineales bacterium]|nr:methyltransferase domain-containing protein [Anaerolineales bacterium]
MSEWDHLFLDADHVLREPDVFVIHFARLLQQQDSRTVLDWGCGAGRHVVYLAQEGFEVTGIDRSPTAIKIAENWLKDEGLKAVLQIAEPESIFADSESYDAVISLFAIEHGTPEEINRTLAEIHRVLVPGGFLLVTLSSGEDSMKISSDALDLGMYAPTSGPEQGIPHYLTSREDLDIFFNSFELLELAHICSRISVLHGEDRMDAHWVVIARKDK